MIGYRGGAARRLAGGFSLVWNAARGVMNISHFQGRIDSVDIAALLLAYGFDMRAFKVYTEKNLDSQHKKEAPRRAYWEFSSTSKYNNLALSDVLRKYKLPRHGEAPANDFERAAIVDKNYQALKSVVIQGKPLFQVDCNGYIYLTNTSGVPVKVDNLCENCTLSDFDTIAIAAALNCKITRASKNLGVFSVDMAGTKEGLNPLAIMVCKRSPEVKDINNYSTIPVLFAMMSNRRALMDSIFDKRLVLCRAGRRVVIPKNADDNFISKILRYF